MGHSEIRSARGPAAWQLPVLSAPALGLPLALACALLPAAAAAQPPVPSPLICQGALAPAGAAAGDRYGAALGVSAGTAAGTAAVGAPEADPKGAASGAVHPFAGGAQQGPRLAPAHGAAGDRFGFAVAVAGDRLVGGAPFRDQAGAESGAAYVFVRQGSAWQEDVPSLIAAGEGPGDRLGFAVAIAGDLAAVGAPGDDDRGGDAGAVYLFVRGTAGWVEAAKLHAADGAAGDGFGSALALAGGTLAVGAPGDDGAAGAVYVFTGGGASWSQQARLVASDRSAGSRFGQAVGLSQDAAAVGAPGAPGGAAAGAIYLFRRSGGAWNEEGRPGAPVAAGEQLGAAVAIAGEVAVAGTPFDGEGAGGSGAVYVFERTGGGWQVGFKAKAAAPGTGDRLGTAVTIAGRTVYAGAPENGAGRVCGFEVPAAPPPPPPAPRADLSVTKTDGVTTAVPGTTVTYVIRAANAGPAAATGARVTDAFPAALSCTWTCAGSAGGACTTPGPATRDIADTVNLPAGGAATFTAVCAIAGSATGTLTNTAAIAPPAGVTDPAHGNDAATDVDTLTPIADLTVMKTAGGPAFAGGPLAYTVAVGNSGPNPAAGATVADAFPAGLTGCAWSCSGTGGATCAPGAGTGDIAGTLTLPVGAAVTYAATCTVSPNATGTLVNTATATPPPGVTDPTPADAASTVAVPVGPAPADLAVTKTASAGEVVAGGTVTYTVTAGNLGPGGVTAATVADAFPPGIGGCTWTCSAAGGAACTAGPVEGPIADRPDLPAGGTATYTAVCAVASSAQATVCNTATVAPPAGTADPAPGNDAATACIEVIPVEADLGIVKTGPPQAVVGNPVGFSIAVANAGPGAAVAVVADAFPDAYANPTWSCAGAADCPAPGSGDLAEAVALPPGGTATFTVTGVPLQPGPLINTATVAPAPPVVDPDGGDNASTATTVVFPQMGIAGSKRLLTGPHAPGSPVTYELLYLNGGPGPVLDGPGDELLDELPFELTGATAATVPPGTGIVQVNGNTVTWNGTLPPMAFVTILISGQLDGFAQVGEVVCNQGILNAPPQSALTDDPALPGASDPTCFAVAGVVEVPALAPSGLALLALLLGAFALRRLRT